MKICYACKIEKPITDFTRSSRSKDGLDYRCKVCNAIKAKKYISNPINKEKQRTYRSEYDKQNRYVLVEKKAQKRKDLKDKGLVYGKNASLKKSFGITLEQYNEMLRDQNYCCRTCGVNSGELTRHLAVDHCHKTGKIRGLLCTKCNVSLGNVNDSVDVLLKMVDYLKEFEE